VIVPEQVATQSRARAAAFAGVGGFPERRSIPVNNGRTGDFEDRGLTDLQRGNALGTDYATRHVLAPAVGI
jgi:hypothetical protein